MSNLPPGCSDSDIPSNSPADFVAEAAEEALCDALGAAGLSPDEYALVSAIGIAAVKALRPLIQGRIDDRLADKEEYICSLEEEIRNGGSQ